MSIPSDLFVDNSTYAKECAKAEVNDTRHCPHGSAKVSLYVASDFSHTYWTPADARKLALQLLQAAEEADRLNAETV
jgi:hypothetical protein